MLELVEETLKPGPNRHADLKNTLKVEDLITPIKDIPYSYEVLSQNVDFRPYERAKHVFSEAKRVLNFKAIC